MSTQIGDSRWNLQSQLEHLQMKYVGTGHADTNKFEWAVNQHRDTAASIIGHHSLLGFTSVVENESIERTRVQLLESMLQPCGKPLAKDD
mmetsp:Transcript_2085/g.4268  ORF Transcript_2085/g.4268 Transcript_2085/m.4268 type:complete len:90 (-) Transcript_2085:277-546(-)